MRLTFLFLFIGLMQVSASLYSQNTKLSLDLRNARVVDVLEAIENQSEFRFAYSAEYIDMNRKVDVEVNGKSIEQTLSVLFSGTSVKFTINDRHIMLFQESANTGNTQQQKTVNGKVTDSSGGPLPGVSVVVKGTTTGTITDADGKYTLSNVPANTILQFSFVGMKTQDFAVGGKTTIDVTLTEETVGIEEVVAVGYGTQKKGNLTTAVASVKPEALLNRPTPSLGEALQGQVSGMSIKSTSRPGQTPVIRLRGATSLNDEGTPLVLIDGVPSDFNFLNMEDVESINVLKDAASSAIYGSRAANGVMLITTKRGKTGKPVLRYNGSVGINTPANMPESVNSATYARVVNDAEQNMGRTAPYTNDDIALYAAGTDPNRYPSTNWIKIAIKNQINTRHAIETSGGTERVKYLLSAGMDYQGGLFANSDQKTFNVRSNTDVKVSGKFNISFDLRYQLRKLKETGDPENNYLALASMKPTEVAYYTDGSYGYNSSFYTNPIVLMNEGGFKYYDRHDASGILKFDYEIIDGLKFTGIANANFVFGNTSQQSKMLHYVEYFTKKEYTNGTNNLSEKRDFSEYYNLQALLTYKKTFGKHAFDGLLGYQQENQKNNWVSAARVVYPTDQVWVLDAGPQVNWTNGGNAQHWAISSVLGRINYSFAGKYMMTASFRSDASSRFAAGNRWATFPSVALAWRASEESFMTTTKSWIDDLKIRVSWGQNGASSGLGLYPSYSTMAMSSIVLNNAYQQTVKLGTIGNNSLGWERTEMLDAGLDFRTLGNRLGLTADYYIKETKDILIGLPVPLEYGFGNPSVNIGKMRNKGWEVEAKWNDEIRGFRYEVGGNLSDNRNEVLDIGGTAPWKASNTYTAVGLPFKSIYGYESLRLFQSNDEVKSSPFQNSLNKAGDVRYKDQNDDKKIDANDRVVIGDPYPHFLYGFRLRGEYKGFDLGLFFQGVGKQDFIANLSSMQPLKNAPILKYQLDYWSAQNANAKHPRILNGSDSDMNYQTSDFWKINAGYLRLKDLQLGYTLPKSVLGNSGFNRVRVYMSINNLFTISKMPQGFDPEMTAAINYPFSRIYSFGLNVQF